MKNLLPLLFLVACTELEEQYNFVNNQINVENKASYAKVCTKNECVCFLGYQLNSQTVIPCSFYDKIEVKK